MAVYADHRMIAVGVVSMTYIDGDHIGSNVSMDALYDALELRHQTENHCKYNRAGSRVMWCEHYREDAGYIQIILQDGNSNVSGVSRVDVQTLKKRKIPKSSRHEGSHYCSHVLIQKKPDNLGRHLVLVEIVPGIRISQVRSYFCWVMKNLRSLMKPSDTNGIAAIKVTMDNLASKTIGEALKDGKLQDIKIRGYYEKNDGLDAEYIEDIIKYELRLPVGKKIYGRSLYSVGKTIMYLLGLAPKDLIDPRAVITIKSENDKTNSTTVYEEDCDNLLGQKFERNEYVDGFETELEESYDDFRDDMVGKMIGVANIVRPEDDLP